jgi:hypothetical protein
MSAVERFLEHLREFAYAARKDHEATAYSTLDAERQGEEDMRTAGRVCADMHYITDEILSMERRLKLYKGIQKSAMMNMANRRGNIDPDAVMKWGRMIEFNLLHSDWNLEELQVQRLADEKQHDVSDKMLAVSYGAGHLY